MASAESLLISAILNNKSRREINRANFTSDNMARYKDHMFFILESKNIPSRKAFKAKFPRFSLSNDIPLTDIDNLVDQCKENKIKQDLSRLIVKAANDLKNNTEPVKIVASLEKGARDIDAQFSNTVDIDVMDNSEIFMRRYLEKRSKAVDGKTTGIPYGIPTVDKLTGGMQNKELITVAARTGIGKSWFCCKFASEALMEGFSVLYLTLEMDWDAIANRIFSVISYTEAMRSVNGKRKKNKKEALDSKVLTNNELNLGMLDERKVYKIIKNIKEKIRGSLYVPDIRGKFSIGMSQRKIELLEPDVVFFDYFGLTQQAGTGKGIDNWVQASEASRMAKEIARTYDIPYVLGAQINRSGASADSPRLEHIALTDSIGQDSDKVYMLKSMGRRKRLQMICEKFRGSYDDWIINFNFDPNNGNIEETSAQGIQGEEEDEESY